VGKGFIEGHHLVPLAELIAEHLNRFGHVALVYSNCHRMLHGKRRGSASSNWRRCWCRGPHGLPVE
jgi:predicted HNH restriction endonuclease